MIIKCSIEGCKNKARVKKDVFGWYCKPCMEIIMKNIDDYLKSDEVKQLKTKTFLS